MNQRVLPLPAAIGGASFGGKDGGSNSTNNGIEAPNTLKSRQVARVIDLLGEGPIWGVCDPAGENYNSLKGVYFDSVAVQRENGAFNFTNHNIQFVRGYPNQSPMAGFPSIENEQAVGVQLKHGFPVTRTILNPDVDRCRLTVSVPSLQIIDKSTGNISGTYVNFIVQYNNNGGGWVTVGGTGYYFQISGKTTSEYERSITFGLPRPGPWDIRVTRATSDATSENVANDLYWSSYTEITEDKINYANSALVGTIIDAEQFRSIPKRIFDVKGLLIRYPSNMDPDTGNYSPAIWDGTFAYGWSNNPGWVLYDLITNNRYGLGDFLNPPGSGGPLVDKWSYYKIGKWCDARVNDGNGGKERRYVCNIRITDQQEAFDLLQQMASIFRGFNYWSGGQLVGVADQPEDPVALFTNANVLDGQFTYSGGDIRQRHTQFAVGWNDPAQLGQGRLAPVEDTDMVSAFGLQQSQFQAYGCTRESEAIRAGNWALYTEQYESDAIHFGAGLEGAYLKPGNIVRVIDANIAGRRRGGRVIAGCTTNLIFFDASVTVAAGVQYQLSCVIGTDAHVETKTTNMQVADGPVSVIQLPVGGGFTEAPQPDTIFIVSTPTLEATLWRIMAKKQDAADRYSLEGVRHYPQKWDYVEKNIAFSDPDVTDIVAKPPAVTNLNPTEYIVQTSAISLAVRVNLSWTSASPLFDVFWRGENENWQHARTDQHAIELPVHDGPFQFQVTPIGALGIKGPMSEVDYTVIGLTALPSAPTGLRVNVIDGVALFLWNPAPEIDVIVGGHYELRYSSETSGANWGASVTVIESIPGSATSAEAAYRPGTWMLRTFDITGRASTDWALIVALDDDGRFTQFYRVCEDPLWLGSKNGTEILMPQQWLVLGQTGGMWDDQTANIDTWGNVDVLPLPPGPPPGPTGTYQFSNVLDAGGVFTIRLGLDLLAFPFYTTDESIDQRYGNVDDWEDWDDAQGDFAGSVTVYISTTQTDPSSSASVWSDWTKFVPGDWTARGFRFMAELKAPPGQNIGIEEMCITGDFRNKVDNGVGVPYSAVDTRVFFNIKFYALPSVVITLKLAMAEDRIEITDKQRDYFDVRITMTSSGTNPIGARSFDWHAQGF